VERQRGDTERRYMGRLTEGKRQREGHKNNDRRVKQRVRNRGKTEDREKQETEGVNKG
jgi:hypothetical protein